MKHLLGWLCLGLMACGGTELPSGGGAELSCGEGTTLKGSRCEALERCGAGTRAEGGVCAPVDGLSCGEGTQLSGNACVAVNTGATCGVGTALHGGSCRVDLSSVCGSGTEGAGGTQCVAKLTSLCGPGTVAEAGRCAVDAAKLCGPGTSLKDGRCELVAANTTLSQFAAKTDLKTGLFNVNHTLYGALRAMVTTLSQGAADDWTEVLASPVGTGDALHIRADDNVWYSSSDSDEVALVIFDDSSGASCRPGITPNSYSANPSSYVHVNFFAWSSGTATPKVCAKAGSLRLKPTCVRGGTCTVTATFNVAFSDGTVWQDKVMTFPFRRSN